MEKQKNTLTPSIFSAIKKLFEILTRKEKIKCLSIIGFSIVVSLFEVLTASFIVVFAQVLDAPSVGQRYFQKIGITGEISPSKIVFYVAIAVGCIFLIKNLIAAAEVFFQNFTIQKMCYEFKNKLLHRYANADYGFFLTRNSSFGLQVVGGDAEQAFSGGMVSFANILSESFIFICLVGLVICMNPTLAFIIFAIGISLSFLLSNFLLPKFYKWGKKLQQIGIYNNQNLMQFFHAFKEIILLGKKEYFVGSYQTHSKQQSKVQAIQTATNTLPRMGIEILFIGLFVLTVSYLCTKHESPMQMIGVLSGYLYVGFRAMPGLNRIINQLNTFKYVIPSIERIHKEYTTIASDHNYKNVSAFKFEQSITFKDVDFKYINTSNNALSDVNLTINKGECIGVIGETGSGKSTLIDLLLGLLIPTKGYILIDNKYPVNSIQWHKEIGYVPQAVYLVDDSIEANIAFGESNIDEDKLNQAIDAAQLRKLIDTLPKGSKTIVGERGIRLSGGERQRIVIARALYRDPEVLVFDEATAALDQQTEKELMETIYKVSQNRTVIMVAHRLSSLKDCNRIIKFSSGKLVNDNFKLSQFAM